MVDVVCPRRLHQGAVLAILGASQNTAVNMPSAGWWISSVRGVPTAVAPGARQRGQGWWYLRQRTAGGRAKNAAMMKIGVAAAASAARGGSGGEEQKKHRSSSPA